MHPQFNGVYTKLELVSAEELALGSVAAVHSLIELIINHIAELVARLRTHVILNIDVIGLFFFNCIILHELSSHHQGPFRVR